MATPQKKIPVHLIIHDPNGPIQLATTRVRVCCTPTSGWPQSASAVPDRRVITCPLCLKTPEFLELEQDASGKSDADAAVEAAQAAEEAAAEAPEVEKDEKPE